jgi:hypothetical protein
MRLPCILIGAALCACVTSAPSRPRLKSSQVARIADNQIGGPSRVSREFDRTKVSYSAEKDVWFVDYREKKTRYIKYNVEINDKTGNATTIVNDYW